jgi:hypothetical protein
MEINGFSGFSHIDLTKLGYICGKTEVNDRIVKEAFKRVCEII